MKRFYWACAVLVLFALILNTVYGQDKKKDDVLPVHPNDLLGCWQGDKEETKFVRFESNKFIYNNGGLLCFFRLTYLPDNKLSVKAMGQKIIYKVEFKDWILSLAGPEKTTTFRKLNKIPLELDLTPMPISSPKELAPKKIKELQEELAKRMNLDQAVRTDPDRAKDMKKVDTDNTAYLKKLVKEIGWIDGKRFGEEISTAAFLIVQHSGDLLFMQAVLPYIEKDVKDDCADPQNYALLYDRVQLYLAENQRYGTQITTNEKGECVVLPLENKNKVDEFRQAIGLFPLATYLEVYKKQMGIKEIKFIEED
jgi:hypothetical protein